MVVLFHDTPVFELRTEEFGQLLIGHVRDSMESPMVKLKHQEDMLPEQVVRTVFSLTAHYPHALNEKGALNHERMISAEDSESVSNEDIEEFARKYIDYLEEKKRQSQSDDKKSENLLSDMYTLDLPERGDEGHVEYFCRIISLVVERWIEASDRENARFLKKASQAFFPNRVTEKFNRMMGDIDSMHKSMSAFESQTSYVDHITQQL